MPTNENRPLAGNQRDGRTAPDHRKYIMRADVLPNLPGAYSDPMAERDLVDRLFYAPDELPEARAKLPSAEGIRDDELRGIYRSMGRVHDAQGGIDRGGFKEEALIEDLSEHGELDAAGGPDMIYGLGGRVPPSPASHYAERIARHVPARLAAMTWAELEASFRSRAAQDDPAGFVEHARTVLNERAADAPAAAPYHLLSIAEVLNQPRPDPLIEGLYSLNSTGIKYGPGGVGKTVLQLDQMGHVALGRPWEGHAVHGGHCVYVCAEGQAFLPERLEALLLKLGVAEIPRLHLLPVRLQLLEPRTVAGLITTFAAELPEPPVWIAFDTVSRTSGGADEDNASDMRDYLDAMDQIRDATGAFVEGLHHSGKDEGRGARGSSVLRDNPDTVILLTQTDGTSVMKCDKQRGGGAPFKPFAFRVKALPLDEDGLRTGPVLEACDAPVKGSMPASYLVTLDMLASCPDQRATYSVWRGRVVSAESTFNRRRDYLVEWEYVRYTKATGLYEVTTKGAAILPRYSHATPTGAA
jgi:hypothetical protein